MPDSHFSVAGIRFRNAGKIFYFHAAGMRLDTGEYVVVETARGPELGRVVIAPDQVVVNELGREELKPILRLATEEDLLRTDALRTRAEELLPEARSIASDTGFPAHIDAAEFTLDGRRLTFSFTSEERLDYRDFLRRAGDRFGVKVDMRQLGARDRAKLAGGYGICGRELCCSNWLSTFPSISIRMAKEQDLPLNPQKISGLCGRLLCCLSYEEEGYKEMRRSLPKLGQRCSTPTGEGKVIGINILRRQVTLAVDGQRVDVPDRDLGLVVRWDTTSKIGDPPPSISRAEAIAQGMIEATEEDLLEAARIEDPDWLGTAASQVTGRGRLPGGGPRKEIRTKPPTADTRPPAQQGRTGSQRPPAPGARRPETSLPQPDRRQPRDQRPAGPPRPERPAGPPRPERGTPPPAPGRVFRRSEDAPPPPARPRPNAPGPGTEPPSSSESPGVPRRRRRGGRNRNPNAGGNTNDSAPE
ncbi:MAG: hypothetical protein HYX53_14555 [Chloroflexi bacterium]|nr:hypothetical protein [Chloroflexota bacterium]